MAMVCFMEDGAVEVGSTLEGDAVKAGDGAGAGLLKGEKKKDRGVRYPSVLSVR